MQVVASPTNVLLLKLPRLVSFHERRLSHSSVSNQNQLQTKHKNNTHITSELETIQTIAVLSNKLVAE